MQTDTPETDKVADLQDTRTERDRYKTALEGIAGFPHQYFDGETPWRMRKLAEHALHSLHTPTMKSELEPAVKSILDHLVNKSRGLERERNHYKRTLEKIAGASGFDNINGWARNVAKDALRHGD